MGWITYELKPLAAHNRISSVSTGGRVIATPRRKKYVAEGRLLPAGELGGAGASDIVRKISSFFETSLDRLSSPQTAGDHRHNHALCARLDQNLSAFMSRRSGSHDIVCQQHHSAGKPLRRSGPKDVS